MTHISLHFYLDLINLPSVSYHFEVPTSKALRRLNIVIINIIINIIISINNIIIINIIRAFSSEISLSF